MVPAPASLNPNAWRDQEDGAPVDAGMKEREAEAEREWQEMMRREELKKTQGFDSTLGPY
jgi:hypothetical protein